MLRRLGSRRAKYFGVLDLTAGYNQTPLSPEAIPLTAFICFMGLFEFTRTPMGLVNAASYFQRFISVVVLAGLMYSAVEAKACIFQDLNLTVYITSNNPFMQHK